jgi:hypothetical protein
MLIEHLLVLPSLCFFNIYPCRKRRRGRPYAFFRTHYTMLHDVPFSLKAVGEGLLPLHEPLKPGLAEAPAGSEAL